MPFVAETGVSGKGYIYVQWFLDKGSISGLGDGLNPFRVFPADRLENGALSVTQLRGSHGWFFGIVLGMLRKSQKDEWLLRHKFHLFS